ncbi:unnamed protein product [Bursaphelenchus okinawaensis]|uniref:Hyaluronan/mRNA-binding protein domain-containing protein n=1 Tax=Bursaphelenchus okinawaensis TaxID=465554 RepID=A0A811KAK6_9BILA|nr:unnamed protein product [Bursaphelenchus okinawaensis]CAG9099303.1 unnamed protein product [Bursaphelenchus okinawaensis]
MSTEYGVNVSNKFGFLDDDGTDPDELLARAAKEKKEKQRLAKVAAKTPVAVAPEPVKPVKENNENRRPGPRGNRGPRREGDVERSGEKRREFRPRRDGEDRPPRRDGEDRPPRRNFEDRPPRRDGEDRPRGPRKPREPREGETEPFDGERRQRRFENRRPRQDRVSGSDKTGVKAVPKKDGHGKGNWGDDKDEIVAETEQLNVSENKENGAEGEEKPQDIVEEVPEEEKEPPKLTLAEWKAQQAQAKQEFKTRKANEGADQKALQKFVPLKKDQEDDDEYEEVEEHIAPTKRQQSQKTVDIHVNFNDPSRRDNRERRNFNDRRQGGDRPQQRGPRQDNRQGGQRGGQRRGPQLDMAADFPALGA